MGSVTSTALFLLFAILPLARGLAAFFRLAHLAPIAEAQFREEYALRRCAELAATSANLRSSARYLAGRSPAYANAVNSAAATLSSQLARQYPDDPTPHDDVCWPDRADGGDPNAQANPPSSRLAATLHDERTPDQPATWPNWVVRFFAAQPEGGG